MRGNRFLREVTKARDAKKRAHAKDKTYRWAYVVQLKHSQLFHRQDLERLIDTSLSAG